MVLVDIGNSRFHIWENGFIYHTEEPPQLEGEIYYISVNREREEEFLRLNPGAVNLEDKVNFFTLYDGLGIDRQMACKTIRDGVVVDAGSAITIDVMEKGIHNGGIILPGLGSFKKIFAQISPRLELEFQKVDFSHLPLNTKEALAWGSIGAVVKLIESIRGDKQLYFTGGDGAFLRDVIGEGVYEGDLIFLGMIRTIEEWKEEQRAQDLSDLEPIIEIDEEAPEEEVPDRF
jgi:type III pantothenate kinase